MNSSQIDKARCRSYSGTDRAERELVGLAAHWGVSKSEAIRRAASLALVREKLKQEAAT